MSDPFADQDDNEEVEPAAEKTPEEAGVPKGAQYQSSALTPVVDSEGNPTNFPPVTNKDAAPWDKDIPGPSEPQVYGRGNIEAAKNAPTENLYSGKGVPNYQLGTLNEVGEGQTAAHLGGLHDKDGNPVNPDGSPVGSGEGEGADTEAVVREPEDSPVE